MPSVYAYKNFKTFLNAEFNERVLRNANYSLRAYARDILISSSRLSEILKGREGIRASTAHRIAKGLKFSQGETEYFLNLVISAHNPNDGVRELAARKMKLDKSKRHFRDVKQSRFGLLTKWYYAPLVEILMLTEELKKSVIGKILRIDSAEVEDAIIALTEMGYIKKDAQDVWRKSEPFLNVSSATPSQLIRNFHHKMIQRADLELERQPIENRKYISSVLGFKRSRLREARSELEKFHVKFLQKYTATDSSDCVYCCNVQLFELRSASEIN